MMLEKQNSSLTDLKIFAYLKLHFNKLQSKVSGEHLRWTDKDKVTFKAIEKYRYGLWKTVIETP